MLFLSLTCFYTLSYVSFIQFLLVFFMASTTLTIDICSFRHLLISFHSSRDVRMDMRYAARGLRVMITPGSVVR